MLTILVGVSLASCFGGKGGDRGSGGQQAASQGTTASTDSNQQNLATPMQDTIYIAENPVVNVYLENSGSMNGYVDNGRTAFQQDVYNYLCDVKISEIPSTINLHFINSQIINRGSVIADFINKLTPSSFRQAGGQTGTTDIADVFKQILSRTDDNTVSIFVSDCIFSPGNVKSPEAYLANQQVGIKECVADYLKNHSQLAILAYQLYSRFDGVYYDYKNHRHQYKGDRPYYIWVIGHPLHIVKFRGNIPDSRFSGNGVANIWCAFNATLDSKYSILPNPKKGDFNKNSKSEISRIKKDGNGDFMFTIGAEMTSLELLLGNDYLMDTDNYARLVNKQPSDKWYIEVARNTVTSSPATHNISLMANNYVPKGNMTVALMCKTPQWVYEFTDEDDTELNENNCHKTYGLKYMFDGIQQAFTAKWDGIYTEMNIKLN